MKVTFYLDEDGEIQDIAIFRLKRQELIAHHDKIKSSLENELPFDILPKESWYIAKLLRRWDHDGAGNHYFDGYDIKKLYSRTRYI